MKHNSMSGPAGNERRKRVNIYGKIILAALALALVGIAGPSTRGDDDKHSDARWKKLVIDVAVDARTAVVNQVNPADAPPKRGDTFIENGKIYPGGTIPAGDGFDIDTTGSIGTSVTRGTFNFDFSQAFTGGDPLNRKSWAKTAPASSTIGSLFRFELRNRPKKNLERAAPDRAQSSASHNGPVWAPHV